MNTSKLNDWLQILASMGVIIGLLLVAVEIRESNRFAKSESIGAMNQAWTDFYVVGMESRITAILEKSYVDPDNLSTEEMMRLARYYDSIINFYTWQLRSYELGTAEIDPVPDFAYDAEYQFNSPFGRAYLEHVRTWLRPEFVEAADVALKDREPNRIPPNIAIVREIMQRQKKTSVRD
jgi:hypothetical protein